LLRLTGFNNSQRIAGPSVSFTFMSNTTDSVKSPKPSAYLSTSINFERRVLKKMKAVVRDNPLQFRSVSALANVHLAKALGLDL
jgi:hypothetical protein